MATIALPAVLDAAQQGRPDNEARDERRPPAAFVRSRAVKAAPL